MSDKTQATFYEPHPVSIERKALLRGAGYRIIDAVFQPEGYENPEDPAGVELEGGQSPDQSPEQKQERAPRKPRAPKQD